MSHQVQFTGTIPSLRILTSHPPLGRGLPRKQQLPRTQAMWIIRGFLLVALAFASFALSPSARAVCLEGCDSINFGTFLGDDALLNNISGDANTAIGFEALLSNTDGFQNTATGAFALHVNTIGDDNTANGPYSLYSNTTGNNNTAIGAFALLSNIGDTNGLSYFGCNNTATGYGALYSNTTGGYNTANGVLALYSNTDGFQNTAAGAFALKNNTGNNNTANGYTALYYNTTGYYNTANGAFALYSNTAGLFNTANGYAALEDNTTGSSNTANGAYALQNNTTGYYNMANGFNALWSNTTGNNNTAEGNDALINNTTGSNNIALGYQASFNRTTGSNNIDIGNPGAAGKSNIIRIGTNGTQKNAYIAGISGVTVANGVGVIVDTTGHLGTIVSSERFKDAIRPMDKASEAILALKPVTFRYKQELDPEGIPQFGLVAEQVEKVNPDLVARDEQGKPYTVRYEAVNAMLLNEFLKEHRKVEEQGQKIVVQDRKGQEQAATITQLKSAIAQQQKDFESMAAHQQKQIEALTAGLQKVSARVELRKPAPQMVVNNQ
jgi:hypothetical protein